MSTITKNKGFFRTWDVLSKSAEVQITNRRNILYYETKHVSMKKSIGLPL